jgi:hypothetical protein
MDGGTHRVPARHTSGRGWQLPAINPTIARPGSPMMGLADGRHLSEEAQSLPRTSGNQASPLMPKTSGCRWCRDTVPCGSPWPGWSRATSPVAHTTVARSTDEYCSAGRRGSVPPCRDATPGTRPARPAQKSRYRVPRAHQDGFLDDSPWGRRTGKAAPSRTDSRRRLGPDPCRSEGHQPGQGGGRLLPAPRRGADRLARIQARHGHPDHLGRTDRGAHRAHLRSAAAMTARRSALPAPGAG